MWKFLTWLLLSAYAVLATVYTTWAIVKFLFVGPSSSGLFFLDPFRPSGSSNAGSTSDPTFLSKAFGNSMQPTRIIPFYYRASGVFDKEDITITTPVTGNRFQVLANLVESYQGLFYVNLCGGLFAHLYLLLFRAYLSYCTHLFDPNS
ncbi:hypothetical protein BS47DRAFT_1341516 [Hydnum rufescens UP504]|uniref:Uncharacterized protein n=1 Tax=Hydnum rufescens UP504 TaxID=1448309 RepID=A0A9P6B1W3_9AGAM|nr:hypothetical protein BS47DRAFT_1341516 [Hydnum rufescens UP504]